MKKENYVEVKAWVQKSLIDKDLKFIDNNEDVQMQFINKELYIGDMDYDFKDIKSELDEFYQLKQDLKYYFRHLDNELNEMLSIVSKLKQPISFEHFKARYITKEMEEKAAPFINPNDALKEYIIKVRPTYKGLQNLLSKLNK